MLRFSMFFTLAFALSTVLQSQQTVGLFLNDSLSLNGYTLFAPSYTTTYLIDNCGRIVKTWDSNFPPGNSVYLLENGNLLRPARIGGNSFNSGGSGGRVELYDWDGNLLWFYNYSSNTYRQHHDIEPLPNGNVLILAWELKTSEEAISQGRNPSLTGTAVWPEHILELEPVGQDSANIVWEWHVWDHLVQDFDSNLPNFGVVSEHPELIDLNFAASGNPGAGGADWIHANAISYNATFDQIAISAHDFNEIWIIDHSTTTAEAASNSGGNSGKGGDLLYRWGNPITYQRGPSHAQRLYGQHDVRWIPDGYPGAGQLMVFNNGVGRPGNDYSTVDVWQPPVDASGNYSIEDDVPFGPENFSWTYISPGLTDFFSSNVSGAHRLENGNTLICEGRTGHFFEVQEDGTKVWDYINPVTQFGPVSQGTNTSNNSVFRATRYTPDYPAFNGKDLTPGEPVEHNPFFSDCVIYDNVSTASFSLIVKGIRIVQNPIINDLIVENDSGKMISVHVINMLGQLQAQWQSADFITKIPVDTWLKGTYIAIIKNESGARLVKQILIL